MPLEEEVDEDDEFVESSVISIVRAIGLKDEVR